MGRRLARETVFKYLYEADINKKEGLNEELNKEFYSNREETKELSKNQHDYVVNTTVGVFENLEKIDKYLVDNIETWNFERVGLVERALLRFAVYELAFTEMGTEIIVNEAVELAKKYGEEKSHEFINGVLAIIIKNIR